MKRIVLNTLIQIGCYCLLFQPVISQNVGIGTPEPAFKLDVNGTLHTTSGAHIDGNVGIGGYAISDPINYRVTVKNGSLAIYNTTADVTWRMNYDANNSAMAFSYGAGSIANTTRLSIANSTGIVTAHNGLSVTGNTAITGNANITGNAIISGNANISGNAVVGGDKPVVRAGTVSGGNIKIHNTSFTVSDLALAAHAQSAEKTFSWPAGIFNNRPTVLMGNELLSGGTAGQLYRIIVVFYNCNTTSCKARLINTSPNAIDYDIITFDVMMIGD